MKPVEFLLQLGAALMITLAVLAAVGHESVGADEIRSVMYVHARSIQTQTEAK